MVYKGCVAAVEFDGPVGCPCGRVISSDSFSVTTFEADTANGLWVKFQQSIDEYFFPRQEYGVVFQRSF